MIDRGDVLIRVSGVNNRPVVALEGSDVSTAFKSDRRDGWIGLITGLRDGDNFLAVRTGPSGPLTSLTLTNHPLNGTLFAGPQQEPFVCENESHCLASPKDASCAAPSTVRYFYRNRAGEWKPFNASAARPNDIGITKTNDGKDIPADAGERGHQPLRLSHQHPARPAAGLLPSPAANSASGRTAADSSKVGGVQANHYMGRNPAP